MLVGQLATLGNGVIDTIMAGQRSAEALAIVGAFVAEPFSGDARHQRRIDQLAAYEAHR